MLDGVLESASVAKFRHDMAVSVVLDDFDASEHMWVIGDGHSSNFFHSEEILGDLVFDGFEVNDLDCDLGLI